MGKKLLVFNLILLALLLGMIIFSRLVVRPVAKPGVSVQLPARAPSDALREPVVHDVDSVAKGVSGQGSQIQEGAHGMAVSDKDLMSDMSREWAGMPQKEKEVFVSGLDVEIGKAKEALVINPRDGRARALLVISESLKDLASKNFNHKLKEPIRK